MARLFDDGASEYLEINSSPITAYPWSFSCWFYTTADGLSQGLIGLFDKDTAFDRSALMADTSTIGDPLRHINQSANFDSSNSISINAWNHGALVNTADNDAAIFLNNTKTTNSSSQNISEGSFDRISIGRFGDSTPSAYMEGRIAEAAIWNVALTDAEAAILAAGYCPLFVRPQNLVAYWSLIRDEDQDRVGGNDLTAFNTPSIAAHPPIIYPASILYGIPTGAAPSISIPALQRFYRNLRVT